MAQEEIHVRFNKRTMGSLFHSLYLDISDDLMIDGKDINQSYPFDNDIQKLSFVKVPCYPKVLIITPRLRLRFTNWDTIEEAKNNLEEDDFRSYQIVVGDETYYIVARAPEDIADFNHPVARLSKEPFDTPFLKEDRRKPVFRPQKAYVTRATARSVALIAYIYDQQKRGQLNKLSNEDIDEYIALFGNESCEFARTYNAGWDDFSIIENAITCISFEKRKELFYEGNINEIIEKLKRRVFHTRLDCPNIRQGYRNLPNSGIFNSDDSEYEECEYHLHVDYLFSLGFRGCKKCNIGHDKMTRKWGGERTAIITYPL